jgi:acetone carboxylase gamma subunit
MSFKCTKDNPWKEGDPTPVHHVDAKLEYSYDRYEACDDNYEEYKCPNCGIRFKVTLPSH